MKSNSEQTKEHKRTGRKALFWAIAVIGVAGFCTWQNNGVVTSSFVYEDEKVPRAFDGFRVVHVSDLHNKAFGEEQEDILGRIETLTPDIIVITGDLIDRRRFDLETALTFVEGAVRLAPVYYVPGNHEAWSGKYPLIKERLLRAGAVVLDNESAEVIRDGERLRILGLSDPGFLTNGHEEDTDTSKMEEALCKWSEEGGFSLLLSHRPELFELYQKWNMDVIFSGHAHGGQVRLPIVGALYAPDATEKGTVPCTSAEDWGTACFPCGYSIGRSFSWWSCQKNKKTVDII